MRSSSRGFGCPSTIPRNKKIASLLDHSSPCQTTSKTSASPSFCLRVATAATQVTLTMRKTLLIHMTAVPPSARLPIDFCSLSLHLEYTIKSDHSSNGSKGLPLFHRSAEKKMLTLRFVLLGVSELDQHEVSIDEALRCLAVAPKTASRWCRHSAALLSSARTGSRPRQAALYTRSSGGSSVVLAAVGCLPTSSISSPGMASHIFPFTPCFFRGL